jgi:hypothetical protein
MRFAPFALTPSLISLVKFKFAHRADAYVFLYQQSDPKEDKGKDKKQGEGDPAGGGYAAFDDGQVVRSTVRAAVISGQIAGTGVGQRLGAECRRWAGQRGILLNSSWLALRLVLVGLPGIRPRSLVIIVRRRLCWEHHLRAAKTAELYFVTVGLTAILTFVHRGRNGRFATLFNA